MDLVKQIADSHLNLDEKLDLTLVLLGEKPGTYFTLDPTWYGIINPLMKNRHRIALDETFEICKNGGLQIEVRKMTKQIRMDYDPYVKAILIAKNQNDFDALKKAYENWDEELLGTVLGYPNTAIEAYMGRIPKAELSLDMHPVMKPFMQYLHSIHFQEEFYSHDLRWHDAIKNEALPIYQLLS